MVPTRVAVALCTYNSERYLREQLASILAQTRVPDAVVVGDDGSSDGTREILASMARKYSRVRLLDPAARLGVAANFERCLKAAPADVVFLCDHDDVWRADKVARLSEALDAGAPAMVFSDARLIDENGQPTGLTLFESLRIGRKELELISTGNPLAVLVRRNVVTGATAALTGELAQAAMPFPAEWLHDEWLAAIAAIRGSLLVVDDQLTDYRLHGHNLVGVGSPTAAARIRRMLASPPDRHSTLLAKFTALRDRALALGADAGTLALLSRKVAFEEARSRFSRRRLLRLPPIVRLLVRGDYSALASQGVQDAVRDLLVR